MIVHFKRLFGQIFYYGLGDAATKFILILILPIFTRYLSPSDYGIAAILTVSTVLISGMADLGLSVSTYRFYYEQKNKEHKVLSTAMLSQVVLTSIIALLVAIFSQDISQLLFKSVNYSYILSLAFLSIPLNDISVTPLNFLKLQGKARTCSLIKVARASTDVLLKIFLVIFMHRGIIGLFEAQLLNAAVYAVFFGLYATKNFGLNFSFGYLKAMVKFGLPFAASTVFFWVLNWADRFILGRLTNMSEVGLYTLGYTLGMAIMLPVGAFQTAWPAFYMSVAKEANTKKFFSLVLTYFSFIIGYFVLVIAIFSRDYFVMLTPKEFHGAYVVVPFIALSYAFLGNYSIMITGTYLKKETKYIFISELITVILNISLMLFLIPQFGRVGAAFATVISYIFLLIFIYLFTRKIFPVRYEYKRLIKIFLVLTLIFWVSQKIYTPTIPNLAVRFVLTLSYPFFLYLLGFFEKKELQIVKEFIQKKIKNQSKTMKFLVKIKKHILTKLNPLSFEEKKIANEGERLVPKSVLDPEVIRHKSSYQFFARIIRLDRKHIRKKTVSILDLGCGVGHGAYELSKIKGVKILGIDNSPEAVSYAQKHFNRPNIQYQVADIVEFLKKMREYDYVVSRGVLEHIPNGLEAAQTIRFYYRLIFDVPYDEKPGPNPHHLITQIKEENFNGFPLKELFYEDLNGEIYDLETKPQRSNMILCVSSSKRIQPVYKYKINFPIPPWQGKVLK